MSDLGWYIGDDGVPVRRTWENIRRGLVPLEDLDDVELARGELRDETGRMSGRKMWKVPPDYRRHVVARLRQRIQEQFEEASIDATKVFTDVMAGRVEATAGEMLRAATYVTERVVGKVPDRVEISGELALWQASIAEILIEPPGDVLDAEIVTYELEI